MKMIMCDYVELKGMLKSQQMLPENNAYIIFGNITNSDYYE